MNDREFDALVEINQKVQDTYGPKIHMFPRTYVKGKIIILDESMQGIQVINSNDSAQEIEKKLLNNVHSYIVQEKLGKTLEDYLFERNEPFTQNCVYKIGIQLLDQIQMIHESGFTFNDLKLDNILVGDCEEMPDWKYSLHKIKIIDFGLAKKYL